jgi:hypothetical protein
MTSPKTGRVSKQFISAQDVRRGKYDPLLDYSFEPDTEPVDTRETGERDKISNLMDHTHNGKDGVRIDVNTLAGFFEVVSTAPSLTPRTFWDSVKLYSSGGTRRLYIYVTDSAGSGGWRYVALT